MHRWHTRNRMENIPCHRLWFTQIPRRILFSVLVDRNESARDKIQWQSVEWHRHTHTSSVRWGESLRDFIFRAIWRPKKTIHIWMVPIITISAYAIAAFWVHVRYLSHLPFRSSAALPTNTLANEINLPSHINSTIKEVDNLESPAQCICIPRAYKITDATTA